MVEDKEVTLPSNVNYTPLEKCKLTCRLALKIILTFYCLEDLGDVPGCAYMALEIGWEMPTMALA
jgi:hypothetical protein